MAVTIREIIAEFVGDTNARIAMNKAWEIVRLCITGENHDTAVGVVVFDLLHGLPDNVYWQKYGAAIIPQIASIAQISGAYHVLATKNPVAAERLKGVMFGAAIAMLLAMFSETNNASKFDDFAFRLLQAE